MSGQPLAERLRQATQSIHRVAERSGVIRQLLRGQVEQRVYCALLRNLHALYEALEDELDRHAPLPALAAVRFPALFRSAPLAQDLIYLHGCGWTSLPLAQAMQDYVARIRQLGAEQPTTLAAHAYVRYMADLSGGQILGDVVKRALSLHTWDGASFYRFDGDAMALKAQFRAALDSLPISKLAADDIVVEAQTAFARHVRLFDELDTAPVNEH
jgi:heme oxygenase